MTAPGSQLNFEVNSAGQYEQVPPTSSRLVSSFLEYKQIEVGVSDLTHQSYASGLNHFCEWLQRHRKKTPITADREDLHRYFSARWSSKLAPTSINHRITILREFFLHLLRDGQIAKDPMLRIEAVKQWKRLPKPITEAEVRQLLAAPNPPALAAENVKARGRNLQGWHESKRRAIALRDLAAARRGLFPRRPREAAALLQRVILDL